MKTDSAAKTWITFFGLLLLLLGVFAAARTAFNIYEFPTRYPQGGVLALNFSGQQPYYQRESDCNYPPTLSYDPSGTPAPPTPEQAKIDQQNKDNCLAGVKDSREQAKLNDIGTSVMLIFVGLGTLTTRRFFFS